jgi:ABC-type Mn2+/Zn2+ transport system permease subunit
VGRLADWFAHPFTDNDFLQRALLAGVLVSIACAVVGTYVVLRGLAFIGDALAHGVLPGVAAAVLIGAPGMLGAAVGAAAMIGGVGVITARSRLSSDTAIGLLFVGLLALGVVIVSGSDHFAGDLVKILFGELLGISNGDLAVQAIATAAVLVVGAVFARSFLLLCFDPDLAQVMGFRSRLSHYVMLVLIATTVIVSFQTVGTLLVFGMLLAPAGVGALLAHRIGAMMLWAAGTGVVATYLGLLASYHFDLAAGASVVLTAVLLFFLVFTATAVRDATVQRRARAVDAEPVDHSHGHAHGAHT